MEERDPLTHALAAGSRRKVICQDDGTYQVTATDEVGSPSRRGDRPGALPDKVTWAIVAGR